MLVFNQYGEAFDDEDVGQSLPPPPEDEQSLPSGSIYDDPALPAPGQGAVYDENGTPSFQDADPSNGAFQDFDTSAYMPTPRTDGRYASDPEEVISYEDPPALAPTMRPATEFSPTLWDVGAGQVAGGVDTEARALDNAERQALTPGRNVRTPNGMHVPVQVANAQVYQGNADIVQGTQQIADIEQEQGDELATFLSVESAKAQIVADVYAAQAHDRAAALEAQAERGQKIRKDIYDSANKMANGPDEDPGQFWASRSGFQKIALVLGAALKGWLQGQGMNVDPMSDIRDGINRNIEAQRSNRAALSERLSARERQARANSDMLAEMTQAYGSKDLADAAMHLAMLKATEAKFAAMSQKYASAKIPHQANKLMGALKNEIAEIELKLAAREVKNPAFFVKHVGPKTVGIEGPDGKIRQVSPEFAKAQNTATAAEGRKEREAGRSQLGKAVEQHTEIGARRDLEILKQNFEQSQKAAAGPTDAQNRLTQKALHDYHQATHLLQEESAQLKDFESKFSDGVPGVWKHNWIKGGTWNRHFDAAQEAYDILHRAVMIRLRKESGAAIGVNEKAADAESALLTHSDAADDYLRNMDEDDILRSVRARLEENERHMIEATRFMTDEQLEQYHKARKGETAASPIATGLDDQEILNDVEEVTE